jgi:hypothetical protein
MEETQRENSTETKENIRITGLNRNKTCKTDGSNTWYQVYFELSGTPMQAWKIIFERNWKALNQIRPHLSLDVNIGDNLLVVRCPLREVDNVYLPALKIAVNATNKVYDRYNLSAEAQHQHRIDVRTNERNVVDSMARLMKFE